MRKTFIDIIESKGFSVNTEYHRLKELFYIRRANYSYSEYITLREYINRIYLSIRRRNNATSLDDFDETYGFDFNTESKVYDLDTLLVFCEYIVHFTNQIIFPGGLSDLKKIIDNQIGTIIKSIGYKAIQKDNEYIFVPKEPAAVEVAESIDDEDVSYKVLYYNHHSLKGDLEGKRQILEKLAHKLEPNEKELEKINLSLKKHLFGAFNNLNIRHNNLEAKDGDYNEKFAQLTDEKKEEMYDGLYKDCLIAFLELENNSKRCEIKDYYKK